MAENHGMIEPFEPRQVRENNGGRVISYGTSSYGYDIRCADEFKIFTNINSAIVDPKNFDENSFVDIRSDVCIRYEANGKSGINISQEPTIRSTTEAFELSSLYPIHTLCRRLRHTGFNLCACCCQRFFQRAQAQ